MVRLLRLIPNPLDNGAIHTIEPRDLRGFFVPGQTLNHIELLFLVEFFGAAMALATLNSGNLASDDTLANHASLELGDGTQDLEHEFSDGAAGVDRFCQAAKGYALLVQLIEDLEQILQASGDSIDFPDHQDVARGQRLETLTQHWPRANAAAAFSKDVLDACPLQRIQLKAGVLI